MTLPLQIFVYHSALIVGRGLGPAAENGTFSDFPKEKYEFIACGDAILQCKMTGGSKPPPYNTSSTINPKLA
jgi:hypothetical protein